MSSNDKSTGSGQDNRGSVASSQYSGTSTDKATPGEREGVNSRWLGMARNFRARSPFVLSYIRLFLPLSLSELPKSRVRADCVLPLLTP
ncbi:hypothetical protein BST61_g4304 [Cercospora zeina]